MENKQNCPEISGYTLIDKNNLITEKSRSINMNPTNNVISKRFYAACAAMQGFLANQSLVNPIDGDQWVCEQAFAIADKMIEMEKESSNNK